MDSKIFQTIFRVNRLIFAIVVIAAQISRNHRVYGDGLLKFEPRDVERLSVPDFESIPPDQLAEIEAAGRALWGSERGAIPASLSLRLNALFE